MGRPLRDESNRRLGEFMSLVAAGVPADEAARRSQIDPYKALRVVTHESFPQLVETIREYAA